MSQGESSRNELINRIQNGHSLTKMDFVYKKHLKEVSHVMKIYEREDQRYIQNMKSSVEEAQKAIRRLDTRLETEEAVCTKCKAHKAKNALATHSHMPAAPDTPSDKVMYKRVNSVRTLSRSTIQ